jgi:hypothetical protein
MGTTWTEDMFNPDKDGFITATGYPIGGHCRLLRYRVNGGYYRARNSWGEDWGYNGDFFISRTDLDKLLKDYGEACLALEI